MKKDKKNNKKYSYYTFIGFYHEHTTLVYNWFEKVFYVNAEMFTFPEAKRIAKKHFGKAYWKGWKGYYTPVLGGEYRKIPR